MTSNFRCFLTLALALASSIAGTASAAEDGEAKPDATPANAEAKRDPAPAPTAKPDATPSRAPEGEKPAGGDTAPGEDRRDGAPERTELSHKRTPPDYDGRGGDPTTVGDVLLWGPRLLLVPPYFVSEYVLRRPLAWAIGGAERAGLPAYLYSFFTFGEDHQAGIFPTAFIDFGFYPSVGLYAFWNDAFLKGHDLRLRGATWGPTWLSGSFASRLHIGEQPLDVLALEGRYLKRPDYTYFGLGPDTRESALLRFGQTELGAKTYVRKHYWRRSVAYAEVGIESNDFTRGGLKDDPVVEDAIARGSIAAPPGYERGYTVVSSALAATLDTRPTGARPGSGVRLAAGGGHSSELRTRTSFVRYGGSVAGFLDVNGRARVLSLAVGARFVDPIARGEIPFTEQVTLGGDEPMRGFYENRLIDRSAVVADLGYRWPIWMWLDGTMHAEIGNVFGEHLSGFSPGKLRFSGAIGVEDTNPGDNRTQLLIGFGSETFESGGKIDSFRFLFGTTYGF
jgi:hypothetical protein